MTLRQRSSLIYQNDAVQRIAQVMILYPISYLILSMPAVFVIFACEQRICGQT